MESDLLRKESEFYKENEKLEQRTKELLRQVNDVMKIQDHLIKDSLRTKTELNQAKLSSFKPQHEQVEGVPDCVDEMGVKNASQFYRAKIKALQVENVKLSAENRKRVDEADKLKKANQTLAEEKEKWFSAYNNAKGNVGKLENQVNSTSLKLQSKDMETLSLKKELEQTKKDLKNAKLCCNNLEVRLNRAYEENEKLKVNVKSCREEEKELKEGYRKQIQELTTTIKQIEKHKIELLNGFKKQLQLIDNLKRQKIYLEAIKVTELAEEDYLKILDWKME